MQGHEQTRRTYFRALTPVVPALLEAEPAIVLTAEADLTVPPDNLGALPSIAVQNVLCDLTLTATEIDMSALYQPLVITGAVEMTNTVQLAASGSASITGAANLTAETALFPASGTLLKVTRQTAQPTFNEMALEATAGIVALTGIANDNPVSLEAAPSIALTGVANDNPVALTAAGTVAVSKSATRVGMVLNIQASATLAVTQSARLDNIVIESSHLDGSPLFTGFNSNRSAAVSKDGAKWVVAGNLPGIYLRSGGAWSEVASIGGASGAWAVCMSDDGQKIFIGCAGSSQIARSTNGGSTWGTVSMGGPIRDIACSADGSVVLAILHGNGKPYLSTDSGATFVTLNTPYANNLFDSCCVSEDGTRCVIFPLPGSSLPGVPMRGVPANAGTVNWLTAATSLGGITQFECASCSLDGLDCYGFRSTDGMFLVSSDGGDTWAEAGYTGGNTHGFMSGGEGRLFVANKHVGSDYKQVVFTRDSGANFEDLVALFKDAATGRASRDGKRFVVAKVSGGAVSIAIAEGT